MPPGTHSHKVRVANGLMVVNHEINGADTSPVPPDFAGGIGIYDVATPAKPREIARWDDRRQGRAPLRFRRPLRLPVGDAGGLRRHHRDDHGPEGPARPQEAGRWWMPGQWTAGGEQPTWTKDAHRCHHPLRLGNRLYTSYWLAGFVILDIEDMAKPKLVSGLDWSPPFACPTHTALPLPVRDPRPPLPGGAPTRTCMREDAEVAGLHVDGRHHGRAPPRAGRRASRSRASRARRSRP